MKLKHYVTTALMLAMGLILHSVVPGFFGMKFDLLLAFMITAICIFPDPKNALIAGISGGILTALTTTFPGGQLPNLVDKIITALCVYLMVQLLSTLKHEKTKMILIGFLGTLLSGSIFLISALVLVGLPAPLSVLFFSVVFPTAIGNTFITLVVYKACGIAIKNSALQI